MEVHAPILYTWGKKWLGMFCVSASDIHKFLEDHWLHQNCSVAPLLRNWFLELWTPNVEAQFESFVLSYIPFFYYNNIIIYYILGILYI